MSETPYQSLPVPGSSRGIDAHIVRREDRDPNVREFGLYARAPANPGNATAHKHATFNPGQEMLIRETSRSIGMHEILNPQPRQTLESLHHLGVDSPSNPSSIESTSPTAYEFDGTPQRTKSYTEASFRRTGRLPSFARSESASGRSMPGRRSVDEVSLSGPRVPGNYGGLQRWPLETHRDDGELEGRRSGELHSPIGRACPESQGTSPSTSTYNLAAATQVLPQPHSSATQLTSMASTETPVRPLLPTMSPSGGQLNNLGNISFSLDTDSGSFKAAEKRRKNSFASKRFRQRKKAGEAEQMEILKKQEDELRFVALQRDFYRAERDYFRDLALRLGEPLPLRPLSPRRSQPEAHHGLYSSGQHMVVLEEQPHPRDAPMTEAVREEDEDGHKPDMGPPSQQQSLLPLHPRPSIGPSDHIPFSSFPRDAPPAPTHGTTLPHVPEMHHSSSLLPRREPRFPPL